MRPKDQGTAWVREIEDAARRHGIQVVRLAEGGSNDPGDILLITPDGDHYFIEAKHRQQLNVHATRDRTEQKAVAYAEREGWHVAGTAVAWKRMLPLEEGKRRRVRAGEPGVFVALDEYMELIAR